MTERVAEPVAALHLLGTMLGGLDLARAILVALAYKRVRSFPIGYLSSVDMFPLDFEEFCWGCSFFENAFNEAKKAYRQSRPADEFVQNKLMEFFHENLLVGGMPAAVDGSTAASRCMRQQPKTWTHYFLLII